MLAVAVIIAAVDAGGFQIGNNPLTYLGGGGVVTIMAFVFRLATKIIERGDTREDRQWKQNDADIKRKDEEIRTLKNERDQYQQLWLDQVNGKVPPI